MKDKTKNTNLLKMLTSEEFVDFCNKKLIPEMALLERQRVAKLKMLKVLNNILRINTVVMILGFVVGFILCIIGKINSYNSIENISTIFLIISVCASLIFAMCNCIFKYITDPIIRDCKVVLYSILMSFFGEFKYYDKNLNILEYENFQKHVEKLKFFKKFNIYMCDDIVKGRYNGLNLTIADILLQYKSEHQKDNIEDIFDGILICSDCNKNFHSTTVVRLDEGALNQLNEVTGLKRVRLEDPVFEKAFEVYSNDQVEARYLLTTAFMDRLLKVQKKLKLPVTCSFENGKIYIALHSNKYWFDISIQDSCLTDIKTYQKILVDLITVLSVLDTLRTDSNIGL